MRTFRFCPSGQPAPAGRRKLGAMAEVLAYVAAGVVFLRGVSHIIPTRQVVAGFGDISQDNRCVVTMQWVAEGLSLIFVAALVAAVTWSGRTPETAEDLVYRVCAGFLLAVGAWTAVTGALTKVIWFRMCPVVLALTARLPMAAPWTPRPPTPGREGTPGPGRAGVQGVIEARTPRMLATVSGESGPAEEGAKTLAYAPSDSVTANSDSAPLISAVP